MPPASRPTVLVDNRDSFTFNLLQSLQGLGAEVRFVRARDSSVEELLALDAARFLIGPGPGGPDEAAVCIELVRACSMGHLFLLGVCLGEQVIARAFGARVSRSKNPVHGRAVSVEHDGHGVFRGIPSPAPFARYNSLSIDESSLPDCLEVTARDQDGDVMGLRHVELPIEGVQFHPDSILSPAGDALIANFLAEGR